MHESCFFQNCGTFCFYLYWKYHNFEQNEIRATGFLKWTDFSHWNFLYSPQILHCHSPVLVLSIQSKKMIKFTQQPWWMGAKFKFHYNYQIVTWLGGLQVRPNNNLLKEILLLASLEPHWWSTLYIHLHLQASVLSVILELVISNLDSYDMTEGLLSLKNKTLLFLPIAIYSLLFWFNLTKTTFVNFVTVLNIPNLFSLSFLPN